MKNYFFLISPQSPYFEGVLAIYHQAFPLAEQHPVAELSKRLENPKSRLFIALENEKVVFMSILWHLEYTDFFLLDYLAVAETHQNKGIGGLFLDFLSTDFCAQGNKIFIEIENPKQINNEQTWRRWHFYRKHGAKHLQGVESVVPPMQTDEATPIWILFLGEDSPTIDGKMLINLMKQLFLEIYKRDETDIFVAAALSSVDEVVRLV